MAHWLSILGPGSLGLSTRSISHEHCPIELSVQELEEVNATGLDWVLVTESDEPPYAPGYSREASNGPMTLEDFGRHVEEAPAPEETEEPASPEPDPSEFPCQACEESYPSQTALDYHVDKAHAAGSDEETPGEDADEAPEDK